MSSAAALKVSISALEEQTALIDLAAQTGKHFADVLADAGLTYDDLRYEFARVGAESAKSPTKLTDFKKGPEIPFVSFFTGCGGMDLGLEAIGWKHVAGFEIQELHGRSHFHQRPSQAFSKSYPRSQYCHK